MKANSVKRYIFADEVDGVRRYTVQILHGDRHYCFPRCCGTLIEARIIYDTLRNRLGKELDWEPLPRLSKAVDEDRKLVKVLTNAISSNDAAKLGPIASLLLVALQRSRHSVGDTLTLAKLLHPPRRGASSTGSWVRCSCWQ